MTSYKDFNYIQTLEVYYPESNNSRAAKIYGNGQNQVKVLVRCVLVDKNNNKVKISPEDLINSLYLCDYYTGQRLHYTNGLYTTESMAYSINRNSYCKALNYNPSREFDGYDINRSDEYVTYYLMSKTPDKGQNIAVGIDLGAFGKFATTQNGTGERQPNGYPFHNPQSLHVSTYKPVDYTNVKNLRVSSWPSNHGSWTGFQNVITDLNCWHADEDEWWHQGKSTRITHGGIYCNVDNHKFVSVTKLTHNLIYYISALNIPKGADAIVASHDTEGFVGSALFVHPEHAGFGWNGEIQASSGSMQIGKFDYRHYFPVNGNKVSDHIVISMATLHLRWGGYAKNWGTRNMGNVVRVTDDYGNSSDLKVTMLDGSWPLVCINNNPIRNS